MHNAALEAICIKLENLTQVGVLSTYLGEVHEVIKSIEKVDEELEHITTSIIKILFPSKFRPDKTTITVIKVPNI